MLIKHNYLNDIIGENEDSFLNIFKHVWNEHIQTFPEKYRKGKQLLIGSRFRPVLVCWGYVIAGGTLDTTKKKELSKLSLYIELMHKATIILDDLIDNDKTRHGEESFHIQYTDNEAIVFSIFLFGDSLEQLSSSLKSIQEQEVYLDIIDLYSSTIKAMSEGVLTELNLDNEGITSVNLIKKIIAQQTVSIIKNGLLTGYKYANGNNSLYEKIDLIGYDCGYIFQVLNDLEPFGSIEINTKHKGKSNIDIARLRKNIVVTFIFNAINRKEKTIFFNLIRGKNSTEDEVFEFVYNLFEKYSIIELIINNLKDVKENISSNINMVIKDIDDINTIVDFKSFLNLILKEAINKIDAKYHEKLSEILII